MFLYVGLPFYPVIMYVAFCLFLIPTSDDIVGWMTSPLRDLCRSYLIGEPTDRQADRHTGGQGQVVIERYRQID